MGRTLTNSGKERAFALDFESLFADSSSFAKGKIHHVLFVFFVR